MDFTSGCEKWDDDGLNDGLHSELFYPSLRKVEPHQKQGNFQNEGVQMSPKKKRKMDETVVQEEIKGDKMKKKKKKKLLVENSMLETREESSLAEATHVPKVADRALTSATSNDPNQIVKPKKKRKRKPRKNKFKDLEKTGNHKGTFISDVDTVPEIVANVKSSGFLDGRTDEGDEKMLESGNKRNSKDIKKRHKKEYLKSTERRIEGAPEVKNDVLPDTSTTEVTTAVKSKKKKKKCRGVEDQVGNGLPGKKAKLSQSNESNEDGQFIEVNETDSDPETDSKNIVKHDQFNSSSGIIYASSKKAKSEQNYQESLQHKLKSARFRFLNEKLYNLKSHDAFDMFSRNQEAMDLYHEGFTQQVEAWPVNPVDKFITYLQNKSKDWIVGDFGCGDAKIAQNVKQEVHSFDLYPKNKYVTRCNVTKVPLQDCTLDVAVFCLSLMGTDWIDFLKEAHRVLKDGGRLKIAEVASRFQSVQSFVNTVKALGFRFSSKDLSNKMFYLFDFVKAGQPGKVPKVKGYILKPCSYKPR